LQVLTRQNENSRDTQDCIALGVDARIGCSKQDIIRNIQIREGYSPCFRTKEACEYDCLRKTDCLSNTRQR
jgi:hypothetical protein